MAITNTAISKILNPKIIAGFLELLLLRRVRAKRGRPALYNGGVAFVSPSPDPRSVSAGLILRVAALCCLCLVFAGGPASAQERQSRADAGGAAEAIGSAEGAAPLDGKDKRMAVYSANLRNKRIRLELVDAPEPVYPGAVDDRDANAGRQE